MEVLSSRLVLHPRDLARSRAFYQDALGLRLFHEYGDGERIIGFVFFLGGGFLELAATRSARASEYSRLWIQVPDAAEEQRRLEARGVAIEAPAERKPWGLIQLALRDPDGLEVLLVEVPEDHFLRRQP